MQKKQMTIAEQAFALHVGGYNLIPLKKDKTPNLGAGEVVPQRTADQTDEQIIKWFKNPNVCIGIITGKKSGITVIDIDNDTGKAQARADEMLTKFPETYTVRTGNGGYQLYYQYQEGFTISANAYPQFPFVDMRNDGGYVVGIGSITDYFKDGKRAGGLYTILKNLPLAPFPAHLFLDDKKKFNLSKTIGVKSGGRNSSLASVVGKMLQNEPDVKKWETEVFPAIQQINKTYIPILSDKEVEQVFNSIAKKEKKRRENLKSSPVIVDGQATGELMAIQKNRSGIPFMTMSNVVAILEAHPDFRKKIRYNTFREKIEINGEIVEDNIVLKLQHTLQTQFGLHTIAKAVVEDGLMHCAYENHFDEAKDWIKSLKWDGEKRLFSWLNTATGVEDNAYNRGVGTQWWIGMVNRIINPGCIFDYMLVLVGGQGIGKTSLFRIIGREWYKSFSNNVDDKDFYMHMRGAILMDLDEGSAMYKSDIIKLKAIITQTHDEFRAPYGHHTKKFARHFVFSMSTNNIEPFQDATGNRRYWAVDLPHQMVNFKWLEDNRDQLFAEALHWLKDKDNVDMVPQVPQGDAERIQQEHLSDDSWTDLIVDEIRKSADYCEGSADFNTTISEIFGKIFPDESMIRLDRKHEIRIGNVFKNQLGLTKIRKMVDGEQKNRWYISDDKQKELQAKNVKQKKMPIDVLVDELKPTLKDLGF